MKNFKILQLERLGKKLNQFIIRSEEKIGRIEISSKVYGPTSENNCKNKLKTLKKENKNETTELQ